jgi:TadE-like protein
VKQRIYGLWRNEHASQMVEFAVSLPLLMVFAVGIFDFSGAFALKHKLANAAREGARAAAADPASDLVGYSTPVPASVGDAMQVVDNYLVDSKINDCGLSGATGTSSANLTWTYTASGCAGGGTLTLTINRGYFLANGATQAAADCSKPAIGATLTILATCVNIQYPYTWRFDRVIKLLGTTSNVPSILTSTAVAINEN